MEYTRGEWKVDRFSGGQLEIISPSKETVICRLGLIGFPEENKANAHLIAASPRMIEFIQWLANNGNQEAGDFIQTLDLS